MHALRQHGSRLAVALAVVAAGVTASSVAPAGGQVPPAGGVASVVAASQRPGAFNTGPPTTPRSATPLATTYTFGQQPLADVLASAGTQTRCAGLDQNQLAAMVLAPTYPETGAAGSSAPSPMTLSRYDTVAVNAGNANLYVGDNPATPYPRAFWNPGVGAWQFDSAGGWPMSTAQEMATDSASATAAAVMATRWCNDTADAGNDAARRAKAWAPWAGCGSGVCESIYQAVYDPTTLHVSVDPSVGRQGGMVAHGCSVPGAPLIGCWRIDPAAAQGDDAFAVPSFGPTPISAPFYDYVLGTTEHRVWLAADTGYPVNIGAALTVGANARTALSWSTSASLCDTTLHVGTCGPQVYLRNSLTSGVADGTAMLLAPTTGTTLMCDWDGNGTDTPGEFVNGSWYVTNSTTGGAPQMVFGFGQAGDLPVCGDWDGNGTDTPGIVRNGVWYLSNTLGNPFADIHFGYGNASGDTPVVGDWDGNGTDTPGVYRAGHWYLVNSLSKPVADLNFGYGDPGDLPVVGDWNGDGRDTPGIVRNGAWFLVNTSGQGVADVSFFYGDASDRPVAGHWSAAAPSTVGVVRS